MFAHRRNVLIAFAGADGETELISRRLADLGEKRGYRVDVLPCAAARRQGDLENYDRIIVGASLGRRGPHRAAQTFVDENLLALSLRPTFLVSVGVGAAAPEGSEAREDVERSVDIFLDKTRWWPRKAVFAAGSLRYSQYRPWTRWMKRKEAARCGAPTDTSRDHTLTDWSKLARDAEDLFPEFSLSEHRRP